MGVPFDISYVAVVDDISQFVNLLLKCALLEEVRE